MMSQAESRQRVAAPRETQGPFGFAQGRLFDSGRAKGGATSAQDEPLLRVGAEWNEMTIQAESRQAKAAWASDELSPAIPCCAN
jgi:hypothetical protein